jgi:hypothetical protein
VAYHLVSCLNSSVVVFFTSVTDAKRVPLSTDLTLGKRKKSHGARSGEYGGCSSTAICFSAKKLLHRESCVHWCIVLLEDETVFPQLGPLSSDSFPQSL